MSECRLYEEGPQAHIMARRFDRTAEGDKRPAKPLCALAHYDYNQPAAYSCELAFKVMRDLRLPYTAARQWQPAPACDVACAYQPGNR